MSTALAVGEERAANGREFIAAVVAGYEVFVRVVTAVNPSLLSRGIQSTGAIGPFGAAAACGKLIGLSKEQMRHALNHAANLGGGALIEAHGARPYFAIQVGTNVEKGILAAFLAKEGVIGCDTILEGGSVNEKGFLQAYSDVYDVNVIKEGLGDRLGIQDTGFSFYLVASFSRTPIDATLAIVKENGIGVEDIKSIKVRLTNTLYNFTQRKVYTADQSAREAYYYIPFHIALALLKGGVDSEMYTDENLNDPMIRSVMEKVQFGPDPKLDEDFAKSKAVTSVIVELTTHNGRAYTKRLDYWRGDPNNPATKEDVQNKFRRITSRIIKQQEAEKIMDLIEHLEAVKDIRSLGELIRRT
jgi:2-methylcitrate dehydratase PrpD